VNTLQRWMRAASLEEREQLAKHAGTTLGTLRQTAGAYRTNGKLTASADLAIAIERGTSALYRPGLHVVRREQLASACAKCEFAKQCRRAK